ncbi:response regulator transcription factor [Paenibacillus tarimensis]
MTTGIVVADDERNITDVCRRYLEREGYSVWVAHDGAEAVRLWKTHQPALVVLDVMMPHGDGWSVCETIRQAGDTPIVMLTARGEEPDRLFGLTLGADDYITKPFSPRELVLRIKNILRRTVPAANRQGVPAETDEALTYEGLAIYPEQRRVSVQGQEVELTAKEFDLLMLLASHPNRVFSRIQLLNRIWESDYDGDTTTVTVHIRRLREKIETDPSEPARIKTVWGIGYKFEAKVQS